MPNLPAAPEHLRGLDAGEWVRLWNRLIKALYEQGTYDGTQRELLERYVDALRLAELHRRAAEDAPFTDSGSRVYAHPGFAHSRAYVTQAQALADLLALTPKARKQLGLLDVDDHDEPQAPPGLDAAPISLDELRRRRAG